MPVLARRTVPVQQTRQSKLGRGLREAVDPDWHDVALRKPALHLPDILLQTPHHHLFQVALASNLDAAREAVRIEEFQEGGEAVGVAIVWRCRQKQPVLETRREFANGAGEPRFDAVTAAGRWRGMVCLVENQQAAGEHRAEPLPHGVGVGRVDQQVVGDEESAVCAPWIHAEAPLASHSGDVGSVEYLEDQAESFLQFGLPLLEHGRRRGNDDGLGLPSQEQFASDQPGLDRLAKPRIVGDEEVDAGKPERFAQRFHLVGIQRDASAERRLEEARVRGGRTVPPQRVEEGSEPARIVETARRQIGPGFLGQDPSVDLVVPENGERFALCVVLGAGKFDDGRLTGRRLDDVLHQPATRAHLDQLADVRGALRETIGMPLRFAHRGSRSALQPLSMWPGNEATVTEPTHAQSARGKYTDRLLFVNQCAGSAPTGTRQGPTAGECNPTVNPNRGHANQATPRRC